MFGKKDEYKNILLFKKGNALVSLSSGWPYKWALRKKNVQDTCCIDIKTMADKEEEG